MSHEVNESLLPVQLDDLEGELMVDRVSPWVRIDQPTVDTFASLTDDHAFIHTDVERAEGTAFGGTIVQGLLLLSLLPSLKRRSVPELVGASTGVMSGFESVRFRAPVPVGSMVRATFVLTGLSWRGDSARLAYDVALRLEEAPDAVFTCTWGFVRWRDSPR